MRTAQVPRTFVGILFVCLATYFAYRLHLNLAATSLLELLLVLAVALKVGFWQATIVSLLANGCLDYFFIPPFFNFHIEDPQNWVALAVFETSALVVSRLSTEAKEQAVKATARRLELEQLYEFSRQLLWLGKDQPLNQQILTLIQKLFRVESAVLFDAARSDVELAGENAAALEGRARSAYLQDKDSDSTEGGIWFRALRLGVRPIGSMALAGAGLSGATANALASLVAIALERSHSSERESRAEAERQSEQLRTTVLDALAHEYKTPLTAIRAATGGLLELDRLSHLQAELLSVIDSETERLTELTTRLLQMSRLDRADVRLRPVNVDVDELLEALISKARATLAGHTIRVEGRNSSACLLADRELVNMALVQFLDNAAKYSDPGSTITIGVRVLPAAVRISVHNMGPMICLEDRNRIFERFYRAEGSNYKAAGTGIGLSISKKVADAHRGRVWVTSEEGEGNTFFLELPRCKGGQHRERIRSREIQTL